MRLGYGVSSSSLFKCFLAIVFLLSVAWKIASPSISDNYLRSDLTPPINYNDLKKDLTNFLGRKYSDLVVTEQRVNLISILEANTASCRLRIVRLAFDGSDRDLVQHLASGADGLFFVFRGRVYTQQPVLLTLISTLWFKFIRKLGLIEHIPPVIAVAANSSCGAERLPWSELRGAL